MAKNDDDDDDDDVDDACVPPSLISKVQPFEESGLQVQKRKIQSKQGSSASSCGSQGLVTPDCPTALVLPDSRHKCSAPDCRLTSRVLQDTEFRITFPLGVSHLGKRRVERRWLTSVSSADSEGMDSNGIELIQRSPAAVPAHMTLQKVRTASPFRANPNH